MKKLEDQLYAECACKDTGSCWGDPCGDGTTAPADCGQPNPQISQDCYDCIIAVVPDDECYIAAKATCDAESSCQAGSACFDPCTAIY